MQQDDSFLNEGHDRRWYDDIGHMSMAICVSRKLPEPIQLMIAKNLNQHIDEYRQMKRNEKLIYSVGSNRALGLYKATNRQRWYDPNQHLHRAFTLMSTTPDYFLERFAERVLDLGAHIEQQQFELTYGADMLVPQHAEVFLRTVELSESGDGIRVVSHGGERLPNRSASDLIVPSSVRMRQRTQRLR